MLFGLVQTKPIQSKTASLGPGPVRPSGGTGPDSGLPQTGSVRTGEIIGFPQTIFFEHLPYQPKAGGIGFRGRRTHARRRGRRNAPDSRYREALEKLRGGLWPANDSRLGKT